MSLGVGTRIDAEVVIVGAGPSGLLLAAELGRAGVDVVLLEQRTDGKAASRAIGVHPVVLARLEASGAAEQIVGAACKITHGEVRSGRRFLGEVRFDRLDARFPFVAAVPQQITEQAVALGGPAPSRGVQVLRVQDRGVHVDLDCQFESAQQTIRAQYVVIAAGVGGAALIAGCVPVRKRYSDRYVMADLPGEETPNRTGETRATIVLHREGVVESFPLPGGSRRLVAWAGNASEPVPEDHAAAGSHLRRAVAERAGEYQLAERIESAVTFGIGRTLLPRLRYGRIIVIGDSAHEISPIGGQGMNLGLLDALTLTPRLRDAVRSSDGAAGLARWETRRLQSARTAARLAGANTRLGRPKAKAPHGITAALAAAASRGMPGRVLARAYSMGYDRDARSDA